MNGQPVKADLEKLLGRKIEIQNDANCFAMAEAFGRRGQGSGSFRCHHGHRVRPAASFTRGVFTGAQGHRGRMGT